MIGYDQTPVAPTAAAPTVGPVVADRPPAAGRRRAPRGQRLLRMPQPVAGVARRRPRGWANRARDDHALQSRDARKCRCCGARCSPALAETIRNNLRRGAQAARFFEIDRVFDVPGAATAPTASRPACGGWASSPAARCGAATGAPAGRPFDFYVLKGVLEDLVEALGARRRLVPRRRSGALPSPAPPPRSARSTASVPGVLGEVDAKTARHRPAHVPAVRVGAGPRSARSPRSPRTALQIPAATAGGDARSGVRRAAVDQLRRPGGGDPRSRPGRRSKRCIWSTATRAPR